MKTINSRYSHLVTHDNTNLPVCSLSTGERTGSSVFCNLWSIVRVLRLKIVYDFWVFGLTAVASAFAEFQVLFSAEARRWQQRAIRYYVDSDMIVEMSVAVD